MFNEIPTSPDDLRAKVTVLLSAPERSVPTTYLSYVRPFGEIVGKFSDLLYPPDWLRSHPASLVKVRLFLYQLMVQLDVFSEAAFGDPVPPDIYTTAIDLARSVSPLAGAIGEGVRTSFFADLRIVHGERWPLTIAQIEADLGVSHADPVFEVGETPRYRTHYREAPESPGPARTAISSPNRPGHWGAVPLERTIRVRIKKTAHGPSAESPRPLLARKPH